MVRIFASFDGEQLDIRGCGVGFDRDHCFFGAADRRQSFVIIAFVESLLVRCRVPPS
jgi:hypothetical protein